jgi:hypothetical protein
MPSHTIVSADALLDGRHDRIVGVGGQDILGVVDSCGEVVDGVRRLRQLTSSD